MVIIYVFQFLEFLGYFYINLYFSAVLILYFQFQASFLYKICSYAKFSHVYALTEL